MLPTPAATHNQPMVNGTTARRGWRYPTAAGSAATALGVAMFLVLSACSGAKGTTGSATAGAGTAATPTGSASDTGPASGTDPNDAADFQKYADCLHQHGVAVPTFTARPDFSGSPRPRPSGSFSRPAGGFLGGGAGGSGGASLDPSMQAARQACASLAPQGGFGRGAGRGGGISATTFATFVSCMKDNGITITATGPQQGLRALGSLNRNDPKTAAALKICQPILGQPGQPPAASSPS